MSSRTRNYQDYGRYIFLAQGITGPEAVRLSSAMTERLASSFQCACYVEAEGTGGVPAGFFRAQCSVERAEAESIRRLALQAIGRDVNVMLLPENPYDGLDGTGCMVSLRYLAKSPWPLAETGDEQDDLHSQGGDDRATVRSARSLADIAAAHAKGLLKLSATGKQQLAWRLEEVVNHDGSYFRLCCDVGAVAWKDMTVNGLRVDDHNNWVSRLTGYHWDRKEWPERDAAEDAQLVGASEKVLEKAMARRKARFDAELENIQVELTASVDMWVPKGATEARQMLEEALQLLNGLRR